ncbi:sugar isomerase domain-containing protein [Rhizobium sp. AN80A]|uniref:sugar isomerase domain-containing protein n=1 Tax=Rhizobium sp. AN80A TaxID=3040673 RepID=UPI0024B36030|nr:sugar isomerase domain-containing protein [Rhizobium sp. AN80A]
MREKGPIDTNALCEAYLASTHGLMRRILDEETVPLERAAEKLAEQIAADRLVYIYGPGGHSNLASQEVFFRAGGLMHISAILDEGTLLSNGALRSMAIERTPGYGRIVIENQGLKETDILILVNAYGINAAVIDAAIEARRCGVFLIGVSSRQHAEHTAPDHPARHPTKQNLHDVVDIAIDCKVPIGDAVVSIEGMGENIAAISTFANAFSLNCLVVRTVAKLVERGIEPPVWRSGNAPGGDEANGRFIANFRGRVKAL